MGRCRMARRRIDVTEPVSVWSEKDILDGKIVEAFVVILRSRGCFWAKKSGCLMCGYNRDCLETVSSENLIAQFEKAMEKHAGQPFVKVYTSGSFLDPGEIDPEARDRILQLINEKSDRVLVESRPEFVSKAALEKVGNRVKDVEIAIGLETADDNIRVRCINKGFGFKDFERACNTAREAKASIRTYLLLKPPYLSEQAAINDAIQSIKIAGPMSQTISINPMNVQRGTVVETLWKKGFYRPPWLWSLLSVLERGSKTTDARIISSPSGGGSRRGVHNCDNCDAKILEAIEMFSLGGDQKFLEGLGCTCKNRWLDYLDVEPFMGTTGDLERLAPP
jgi:radical SAM enzyme (TIGR01210 family)